MNGLISMSENKDLTIVLLHGWGHSKKHWSSLEQKLSTDHKVVSLDFPGFGDEPLPPSDWGIPEYSEWLAKQIDKMDLKSVVLIGHSFGGRVAAYTASKNPSWLNAIVLSGAPAIYRPSSIVRRKIMMYKIAKKILPTFVKNLFINKEDQDARSRGLGRIRYKAITFDQTEDLPKISVPTLIINGEKDEQNPVEIAKEVHTLIPNSQLEIIKGGDHFIFANNEYLFYGKVINFLKSL